jgi:predicted Zn-dependent protease
MRQAGLAHLDEAFKAYKTRLEEGSPAPVPSRLVGAANLFLSLNRFREAAAIYAALTRGAPAMTDAWRGLGICQLQMGEAARAVESLEQARDMQPKDARTWLLLSRAYAGAGMTREAEFAFAEGAALNPSTAEAFGNPTEEAEE